MGVADPGVQALRGRRGMGSVGAPAVFAQFALHAVAPELSCDRYEWCPEHRMCDGLEEGYLRLVIEAAHCGTSFSRTKVRA